MRARRCFFFSSRRRHTRSLCDWSSDVCSSDLGGTSLSMLRTLDEAYKVAQLGGQRLSPLRAFYLATRSEERRVGKEWRSRRARYPTKKKKKQTLRLNRARIQEKEHAR